MMTVNPLALVYLIFAPLILTACGGGSSSNDNDESLTFESEIALGEALFHDTNLSLTRNQSCATCHNPNHAFVDVRDNEATDVGVSLGDDNFSIGVRNTPTIAYAEFAPEFSALTEGDDHFEASGFIGGQFLDGREADMKGQAGGPPLNPVEMGMPDKASVIDRIKENPDYIEAFQHFYGETVFDDTESAYLNMTIAIAKFEKTEDISPFTSKWDDYLMGEYQLSFTELTGKSVFFSPNNSSCVNCHMLNDDATTTGINDPEQTFTNFKYFNLGVPKNQALIDLNEAKGLNEGFRQNGDMGLFENDQVSNETLKGKFKTPTLRNVAVTGPYMHNGVFKNLATVLEFYNFRSNTTGDNNPLNPETGEAWADTPFPDTIDHELLGQTPMSQDEIDGLVCFLRLLTDKKYEALMPPVREGLDCSF